MPKSDHLTQLRTGLVPGFNRLLDRAADPEVGMDFGVHRLRAGERLTLDGPDDTERALLVLSGSGRLGASGQELAFARTSWIDQGPAAAHAAAGTSIDVLAESDCELAILATANPASFAPRLYSPAGVPGEHRGKGILSDMAYRIVRTVFDGTSAPPQALLVLGEVVNFPGRWSSYPPHHHPQPEIYYYRFLPEQGYGHGELGEEVFKLQNHDVLRIVGERDHAQVSAPGYHMYYLWAVRHLPGKPYTGFEYNPQHQWLLKGAH